METDVELQPPPRPSSMQNGRVDSLEREATNVTNKEHGLKVFTWAVILRLAFQTLGVVYGDIGTSPLYVFSSTFPDGIDAAHTRTNVLGVCSLIIYSLTLSPLLKYVFIVLRANDNGEGGTFALYSLLCRYARIGLTNKLIPEDRNLSAYKLKLDLPTKRCLWVKQFLEGRKSLRLAILLLTCIGTCMVIGDGTITPVMSVLSAVEGIQLKCPNLHQSVIVWVSIVILVGLFSLQRYGTDKVGFLFAPVLTIWFAMIAIIGLYNIIHYDIGALKAFNPKYIVDYFVLNKSKGFISLGGVVLCITGTEAMFADLGHFSAPSIQIAFTSYVYPSLLLAYIGQAAYLLKHPENVSDTFYASIPKPIFWPMFVVAVLAAIIASQAMISAVFQIIKQAEAMSCFPRIKVIHTSKKFAGQVYIPEMNWFLMCACILITATFRDTVTIGNAYGICVVSVMAITSTFTTIIMLMIWQTNVLLAFAYLTLSLAFELTYFSSVLYKFKDGGWLPILFAALFLSIMSTWFYGSSKRCKYEVENKISVDSVMRLGPSLGVLRVPSVGLVYTELSHGIPSIFSHYLNNLPAMHSVLIFVSIRNLPVSNVLPEERFLFRRVGSRDFKMYRCVARYGYQDRHTGDTEFEDSLFFSLAQFISSSVADGHSGMEMDTPGSVSVTISSEDDTVMKESSGNSVVEELEYVEASKKGGVRYLLGDVDVRARMDSNLMNKFVIDYVYSFLRKNFRESTLILNIPHSRLLKGRTIYYI